MYEYVHPNVCNFYIVCVFNDSSWTYTSFLTSSFSECETYNTPPPKAHCPHVGSAACIVDQIQAIILVIIFIY